MEQSKEQLAVTEGNKPSDFGKYIFWMHLLSALLSLLALGLLLWILVDLNKN